PIEMEGTYPLPEAQRDRFLMEVVLTSPDAETLSKIAALTTINEEQQMESCFTPSTFSKLRETVRKVIAAPAVLDRAARWIAATRPEDSTAPESVRKGVRLGAGARALQALILCGKVEALRAGRTHLADEDWQTWREEIIRHRLVMSLEGELQGLQVSEIVRAVDKEVS
ncbi:MAG: AAA family ATPase, partial [Planctomycetia bacterium]|nr:AAA family ATPase [Planctomycetia bacterium]